jgi:hypothetical protein
MTMHYPRRRLICTAVLFALAGCGDGGAPTDAAKQVASAAVDTTAKVLSEADMVAEVAGALQACSYDGSLLQVDPGKLALGVNANGRDVVAEIMRYTGLPQNFDVLEGEVPNAAAVILLGPDKLPRRVIAYNPTFMGEVRAATANNDWAPISIMAHEIGHHLSGHTIMPGGSQPPTELEADKFSGFVLYKMGAQLPDAQKAMNTLVPEADGKTHPGRSKRVRAIEDGWNQACTQQSNDCSGTAVAATPAPAESATPAPSIAKADAPVQAPTTSAPLPAAAGRVDVLPAPDANAIPAKFDRFVMDETGLLDPAVRADYEKQMYEHAKASGVEIVSLLVNDLHGLSADDYATAMMRQLRVGKLDVGNGAVLVVHARSKQVGVALGAGVHLEFHDRIDSLKERLQAYADNYDTCKSCPTGWSDQFFSAADHIRRDTDSWEWAIRYQSLDEILVAAAEAEARLQDDPAGYDPETDPTWRKITRVQGKLTARQPADRDALKINDIHEGIIGGKAMTVQTADGKTVVLYVNPQVEKLMVSPLEEGRNYAFVARQKTTDSDMLQFDLLSYDAL